MSVDIIRDHFFLICMSNDDLAQITHQTILSLSELRVISVEKDSMIKISLQKLVVVQNNHQTEDKNLFNKYTKTVQKAVSISRTNLSWPALICHYYEERFYGLQVAIISVH